MFRNMSSEERPAAEAAEAREVAIELASSDGVRDVTDPRAMRALAHPVRMALIELLGVAGTLTATQASEALGESPANCAFHLRTLAKYGYVTEAGGGKGRERPWKAANTRLRMSTDQHDPGASVTARTLQQAWLDRLLQRARRVLTSSDELPEGWRDAEQQTRATVFLTAEECRQLGEDVLRLLDRYRDRQRDPSLRPAGALPVENVFLAYPLAELAGLAGQAAEMSDPAAIMNDL
jgi:hypothetical protein